MAAPLIPGVYKNKSREIDEIILDMEIAKIPRYRIAETVGISESAVSKRLSKVRTERVALKADQIIDESLSVNELLVKKMFDVINWGAYDKDKVLAAKEIRELIDQKLKMLNIDSPKKIALTDPSGQYSADVLGGIFTNDERFERLSRIADIIRRTASESNQLSNTGTVTGS